MAWDTPRADGVGDTLPAADYNTLVTQVKAKAPTASPTFTGAVVVPNAAAAGHAVNQGQMNTAVANRVVNGGNVATIQALTQAAYDAIPTPNSTTLYIITDA